jgi:hypothetical protein
VAHTYNTSYLGAEIRRIVIPGWPWKTVSKTLSQWKKAECGGAPVILERAGSIK